MDCRGNTARLLRFRQHTDPIPRRHDRHDRRGLRGAGRAGADLHRRERLHGISHSDYVKLVGPVNYAAVFPRCRAVVHHGGAGTTAACLRAGVPMVVLWDVADQPIWAAQVTRMRVGRAQRLSTITGNRWSRTSAMSSRRNTPSEPAKSPPG